jgi:hypothetical protein
MLTGLDLSPGLVAGISTERPKVVGKVTATEQQSYNASVRVSCPAGQSGMPKVRFESVQAG